MRTRPLRMGRPRTNVVSTKEQLNKKTRTCKNAIIGQLFCDFKVELN